MSVDLAQLGFSVDSTGAIKATKDLENLTEAANDAEGAVDDLGKTSEKSADAQARLAKSAERYGKILGKTIKWSIVAMTGLAANSLRLGIAVEETANKFQMVFRGSVEKVNNELIALTKTIPITVSQARELASGIQTVLVPMGMAREEAANFSVEAVKMSGAIATFNKTKADVVLKDIQSALAGSSQQLQKYGIDATQARLKSLAYEKGLIGVGEELTRTARAQALFIAITRDASDALKATDDAVLSTSDQMDFLRRDFTQASEDLGQALVPAFRSLLEVLLEVDAEGLTPLQRGMQAIATFILLVTKYVLLMVAGFLKAEYGIIQFINTIDNALTRLSEMSPKDWWDDAMAGMNFLNTGVDTTNTEEVDAAIEDARKSSAELNAELETRLAGIFALVDGVNASIVELASGVDRSLDDVNAGMLELLDTEAALIQLTPEEAKAFETLRGVLDPTGKAVKALAAAKVLLKKAFDAKAINAKEYEMLAKALDKSALALAAYGEEAFKLREMNFTIKATLETNMEFVDGLEEAENAFNALERSLIPSMGALQDWQDTYNEAFQAYVDGDIDPERWDRLQKALNEAEFAAGKWGDSFEEAARGWLTTLESLRDSYDEDSRQALMLNSVIQLLNVALSIQAVIKQLAGGDVWSAIPRALGVAAMIGSMGVSTGASGSAVAERTRQETQGTGSVLGDAEAKSESILNASEITAKATTELVGINRGMLNALQSLTAGVGGASTQLVRGGVGDTSFGGLPKGFDFETAGAVAGGGLGAYAGAVYGAILGGPIGLAIGAVLGALFGSIVGKILGKIIGSKSKVLDQGIQIIGGTLGDLSNEVLVQAFQDYKTKKWWLGGWKEHTTTQGLPDEIGAQLALVFGAIGQTVMEAAVALGLPLDLIEERISKFEIATTKISLEGLSGEEQQEAIIAVFSKIFDDLAGDVVPFIGQFQKVGEGLGETLVRVATSVQVFREAVDALGFVIDTADPELFAQIAVGLVELTGGVENFISMFTTFFDLFASEEQKLEFITNQVTRAFEGVGLTLPKTRDAIFDLMMTLDATTEEGRRQIAMLLELAPVLDEYYSLMEEGTEDLAAQAREFADIVGAFIGIGDSSQLRALKNSFNEAMDAAKALNATQKEYAMITRAFNMQLKRMAAELTLSVLSLVQQLFGEDSTYGDPINDGLEETREVANSVFTEWQRALEDIYDYTQQLLLDENLTTLTPAEQLSEAQKQFNEILAKAQAGDVEAAAALPDAAQALLEEARFMFASGQQYTDIFDMVLAALNSVKIPANVPEFIKEEEDKNAGIVDPIVTAIDEQTKALQRYLQALDLAATLRDLSRVLNVSVLTLAQELGVPLRELAQILGVNLTPIDNTTAEAIGDLAVSLGADIFELLDALGVDLFALAKVSGVHIDEMSADLVAALGDFAEALGVDVLKLIDKMGIPIAELAKTFGIGIDQFSAEQFKALVAFSESLGAGITDVAEALNINLGDIRDATSILSQALGIAIGELPPDIQVGLGPYLEAIREATNDADANNAIDDLGKYVLSLPPDIAAPLIPFLEAMGFENIAPELSMLFDIEKNTRNTVEAILKQKLTPTQNKVVDIADKIKPYMAPAPVNPYVKPPPQKNNLDPIKYDPYKKGFATGGYVGQTGLHQLHAGEFVINKSANNVSPAQDNELTVAELSQIRTVLSDIRDQQRRYQEADLASSRNIESSMKQQAEQTRRTSNG